MQINQKSLNNLIPFNKMSKERHIELSKKGGKRSAESRIAKSILTKKIDLILTIYARAEKLGVSPDEVLDEMYNNDEINF